MQSSNHLYADGCETSADYGDVASVRDGEGRRIKVKILHIGVLHVRCGIAN